MFERFTRKSLIATAAALLAALGVGGAAIAQSGSGSQATPSNPGQSKTQTQELPGQESNGPENSAADTDNVQAGDQTSPDPAGATGAERESGTEQESGSEVANDDGPGGHADEPGNSNADHQAQGVE